MPWGQAELWHGGRPSSRPGPYSVSASGSAHQGCGVARGGVWKGGQHPLLPLHQRDLSATLWGFQSGQGLAMGHADIGGGTWRAAGPCPGELGAVGTVGVSFRVEGQIRPGQWTLGSGWGTGIPISLWTVCLPGSGPWWLGGRACPEQWPESGGPAAWGRGGRLGQACSVWGHDPALLWFLPRCGRLSWQSGLCPEEAGTVPPRCPHLWALPSALQGGPTRTLCAQDAPASGYGGAG